MIRACCGRRECSFGLEAKFRKERNKRSLGVFSRTPVNNTELSFASNNTLHFSKKTLSLETFRAEHICKKSNKRSLGVFSRTPVNNTELSFASNNTLHFSKKTLSLETFRAEHICKK